MLLRGAAITTWNLHQQVINQIRGRDNPDQHVARLDNRQSVKRPGIEHRRNIDQVRKKIQGYGLRIHNLADLDALEGTLAVPERIKLEKIRRGKNPDQNAILDDRQVVNVPGIQNFPRSGCRVVGPNRYRVRRHDSIDGNVAHMLSVQPCILVSDSILQQLRMPIRVCRR